MTHYRFPTRRGTALWTDYLIKIVSHLVVAALTLVAGTPALAQSRFAVELRTFAARYHENPARLDAIRDGLAQAVKSNPHLEDLTALARVCFIWGGIRAMTPDQKLEAYEQGRQAARRAVELDPKNVVAHFWYATNTARWGQTKGVLRSLFLLPTVNEEIQTVLDLDPKFTPIYGVAGNVAYEVPQLLGGDLNKAEKMFRKGLELDPKFTAMRVGLSKTLIRQGRITEARRELQAVLDEKEPQNLADWTMKDSKKARELLESIKGRS